MVLPIMRHVQGLDHCEPRSREDRFGGTSSRRVDIMKNEKLGKLGESPYM